MIIKNVPPELHEAINTRVLVTNSNMNDVLVGILARHYKVPFEPTGRRAARASTHQDIVMRVPLKLRIKINMQAKSKNSSARTEMLRLFEDELLASMAAA